jgi:hypothetical protein
MPNPLWVDARDYLTNKGMPITTGNLNSAMGFLAQNIDARPSYAKASPDAATSIAAGLGAPTDDFVKPVAAQGIKSTPLAAPKPTSYTPPQSQARAQPRSQGKADRTEKTASTGVQPKTLPTKAEAPTAAPAPIVSPVSTGSDPNIHGTPANVAPAAVASPSNVNPAIPDVSNGAYAPGGLENPGAGTLAGIGGLGAALLAMILSKGRGGRVPNAPAIPGVGASPMAKFGTPGVFEDPLAGAAPYGTPGVFTPPKPVPDPLANAAPYGTPAVMADRPPNQSVTPYSGEAPATMPPQLEDLIAELTSAPPNRSIMGTTKGTKPPTPPPPRPKAKK